MSIPTLGASGRDIKIDLNDSCNCCCFKWRRKKLPLSTPIFMTATGEVVPFSATAAQQQIDDMNATLQNLHVKLEEIATTAAMNKAELVGRLEQVEGVQLGAGVTVTLGMIKKINAALKGIFS